MDILKLSKVLLCVGAACQVSHLAILFVAPKFIKYDNKSFSTLAILHQVAIGKAIGQSGTYGYAKDSDPVAWEVRSSEQLRFDRQDGSKTRSFEAESCR
jgi:hypothetical protein